MRRTVIIGAIVVSVGSLIFFWKYYKPKQEIYEVTKMRQKQTHNEPMQKPLNDTAKGLDREADYSQTILSRAAIELNRAACLEKKKILSHALEQKSRSLYISFLQDLTTNKCSQFIKQNTNALLKTTLNEQNLIEFLDDYGDLLNIARGISYLELFKSAIDELEKENSEELKKSIFLALNRHIEDSTTMMEVAISLATIQKLAQKNFLSGSAAREVASLEQEFTDKRIEFVKQLKILNEPYNHIDLMKMSSSEITSNLGVKGVKNVFFESFEKENQLAEEFKDELLEIIK